ncbi:hypothetical protein ACJX0J_022323, partial [Zea mays]
FVLLKRKRINKHVACSSNWDVVESIDEDTSELTSQIQNGFYLPSAISVGLKDFDHLEPYMIYHAARLSMIQRSGTHFGALLDEVGIRRQLKTEADNRENRVASSEDEVISTSFPDFGVNVVYMITWCLNLVGLLPHDGRSPSVIMGQLVILQEHFFSVFFELLNSGVTTIWTLGKKGFLETFQSILMH